MNKIIINIILIFSMLSTLTSCNTASSSSDQDVYHPLKVSSGRWSEMQSVNIYYYAHSAMLSQEETEAIIDTLAEIELTSAPVYPEIPDGGPLADFEVVYNLDTTIRILVYYDLYIINDICFPTDAKELNAKLGELYSELFEKYFANE